MLPACRPPECGDECAPADRVACVIANAREIMSADCSNRCPGGLQGKVSKVEGLIVSAEGARKRRKCERKLRAAVHAADRFERKVGKLVAQEQLPATTGTVQLIVEAGRLYDYVAALEQAADFCSRPQ